MSDLFGLIWVVFIVVALVNSGKKKNPKKQSGIPPLTAQPVAQQRQPRTVREREEEYTRRAQTATATPAPRQEQTRMPLEAMQPARTVAEPRVHTHLAPDCDQDGLSGSMDFISTEGVDPCHDDELPGRQAPRPTFPMMQERPGLALEWTGDALVKSVIMQEVLTRPCQRRRR